MRRIFFRQCPVAVIAVVMFGLAVLPRVASAIEIQRVTSPGGIEAWLVRDTSVPVISFSFAFRAGASLDPVGKEGRAEMVSGLLDEGAGDLKSQDFQAQLEDIAARLHFSSSTDRFSGTLRTLSVNRDKAFRLLALALTKPRFDAKPVERIRAQIIAQLRSALQDPLDEGAGDLKSQDFQAQLEDIAARLHFSSSTDRFSGTLRTLSVNRDKAFRLLALALTKPRFDAKPVERIRAQIIAQLRSALQDPNTIASRAWYKKVFPNHPYGRPNGGTIESVKAITIADLRDFTKRHFMRQSLVIGAAGDISADELVQRLDQVFGGLPRAGSNDTVADVKPAAAGKLTVIKKAVPQSVVMFGQAGLRRDDPDWYTAYIMMRVLGGGGSASRLTEEVREKRGLAYSVYSYLNPYDHSALIMGGVATANARVAESLKVIRAEWRRMADNGVTADELASAKTYINGSFPLRLDSTRRIASMLVATPPMIRAGSNDTVADVKPAAAGKLTVIKKAVPQSVVMFGQAGLRRDDPDWYTAYIMMRVLGGGGSASRLTEEVREKRGLAYSVYSYLNPYDHSALIMGGVATANARVAESLKVIRAEWRRMADNGVTADELASAKTYINGSFPLRLDSTRRIASMLVSVQLSRLGIDYLDRRHELMNKVTVADIQRVARRLLKADALTVVVVGQPTGLSSVP